MALADNLKREAKVRRDHPDDYDAEITSWIEQAEQIVRATSVANPPAQPVPQPAKISDGTIDTLLSKLDQGAAYQGYPEGFGFSWTKLAGDAAVTIRRLRGSSITSTEGK